MNFPCKNSFFNYFNHRLHLRMFNRVQICLNSSKIAYCWTIFFLQKSIMKSDILIMNCVFLSSTNIMCRINHPHKSKKIWNQGDSKNSNFFNSLVKWEKFGSKTYAYIQKTPFSSFFMDCKKLINSARATFKNLKICVLGKTWE